VSVAVKMDQKASDTRFWFVVSALVGALALLKGIRLPNRWAATQAQLDYSQGFVKRGLFGAAVAGPLGLGHYARFAVVSYALLAVLCVLVIALAMKSGLVQRLGGAEMLAVFCGCYGVSTIANTVGYLDIPLAILAVCVLFVKNAWARFAVGLPLVVIALLIHELFLFVFLPVVLLSFVVQGASETSVKARWRVWVAGAVLMVAALGVTLRLALERPMTPAEVATMSEHVAARVDFVPRADFFVVMLLSSKDNFKTMTGYFKDMDWYGKQISSVLIFGPSVLLLLFAAKEVLQGAGAKAWLIVVAMLCACSPLAMHVLAWDVGRFNGLLCLTAFLALIVAVRFSDGPMLEKMTVMRKRVVVLVLLGSMASGGLLMGRTDKVFPAYPQMRKFRKQMHTMSLAQIANLSD
jgi:hypothetical protein